MSFSNILVATDFSQSARNAVLRAARLARHLQAALHIVHVEQPSVADQLRALVSDSPSDLQQRMEAAIAFDLEELVDAVQREYAVAASVHRVEGAMPDAIEQVQRDTAADLTVIGARGVSVVRHLLLGSTAERLLARARHPILVVRLPAEVTYRRTLIPVDFTQDSATAVERARVIAPDARVTLLHAFEAAYEGKLRTAGVDRDRIRQYVQAAESSAHARMSEFAGKFGDAAPVHALVVHGNPFVHTIDQEEELGSQLVVVGKGSGSRVEDYLFGSISRRILTQSGADVLLSA